MDLIIIICLCILVAVMLIFMFSHSQSLQRFGGMEFLLLLSVVGSVLAGFQQAKELTIEQYFEIFSVYFGNAYSYMQELEQQVGDSQEAGQDKFDEAEQLFSNTLPVTTIDGETYKYLNVVILRSNGYGGYYECFFHGDDADFWKRASVEGIKLINDSLNTKTMAYQYISEYSGYLALTDRDRISPKYAIVAEIPMEALQMKLNELKMHYFMYTCICIILGTVILAVIIFLQGREIRKVIRFIVRVSEGKESWDDIDKMTSKHIGVQSNEMRSLYNSLRQIASDVQRMNYLKYRVLQAYYRFAPKEIEKILAKQSILDVEPSDRVNTSGVLSFVSFFVNETTGEQEYVNEMNQNYTLLEEIRKEYGGIVLAGNSEMSTLKIMFKEDDLKSLQFGIEIVTRKVDANTGAKNFALLHKTSFLYGVVGSEEQAFTYIHAREMNVLEKYVNDIRSLKIPMAVTDTMYDLIKDNAQTRYIGFIKDGRYTFKIYEILDAYSSKERLRRIDSKMKFQKALNLFYQSDFYLARNLFSEILKECIFDEVAKWYLFLCEEYLNGQKTESPTYAIFDEKH